MTPDIDVKAAFSIYEQNNSLRKTAEIVHASKSSLARWFKRIFGANYSSYGKKSLRKVIIEDYLNNSNFNEADKSKIKSWYEQNLHLIIGGERQFYSEGEINRIAAQEEIPRSDLIDWEEAWHMLVTRI
jgi:AraC-like DNA-binding protein